MKKFIFSLIVLAIALLFFRCKDQLVSSDGSRTPTPGNAEKSVAASSGTFGLKLFRVINDYEENKNIFISPLSISMALGMTLNGANGATYDSMKAVLELGGLTQTEINEAYKNLINLLTNDDPKVVFNIANSIWYRNTLSFQQYFINTNKSYFNAEVNGLDFNNQGSVDIINNWVDENTNGKIKKIINQIPADAIMYLINAIYFKGDWKYQFDKDYTKDDLFTKQDGSEVSCKMMEQENKYNYLSNDIFQAVELPYGDSSFSMIIFLPKHDISDLLNQFDETNWNSWMSSFNLKKGDIWLPKFELNYDINLNKILIAMGMKIAFSASADFTKIYPPGNVFISSVKHKSYVKVDEEGTEAAAVTSIEMSYSSAIGEPDKFYMRMNKPFIFVIKDNKTNSLLFMGKIVKPEL
jgi:serine protease inhibitor